MSFKEVTRLRKTGQLDEAFELAKYDLDCDPDDDWNKRAMVWVYYEYLKIAQENRDFNSLIEQIENIEKLNLPDSEKLVFDSVAWQVGKYLFAQNDVSIQYLNKLFDSIKDFSFTVKTDSYSYLIKAFKKHAGEWLRFIEFAEWWGLNNFKEDDYAKFTLDNGREIPATAESVYIAVSKLLLKPPVDIEKIQKFVPEIASISALYPKMQYPPFYHAKLMIALGNKKEFLKAFIPFARKKTRDFWVWDLLSDAFDKTDPKYVACICRSLLCRAPEKFTVNVHDKMVKWLITEKMYAEAKNEIQKIIDIRTQNNWKIPKEILDYKKTDWWKNTKMNNSNIEFYKKNAPQADTILLGDLPEEIIIIDNVNIGRQTASFVAANHKTGFFNYSRLRVVPQIVQLYSVRFFNSQSIKSNFYKVADIQPVNISEPVEFVRNIKGKVEIKPGNSFGFIENVFIPHFVISKYRLKNGDRISVTAVESYNKNKKTWGWKVVKINN
jgi:hypothetical protein